MADLAGESEVPGNRAATHDQSSPDADLTRHEDHVVGADSCAEARLGERAEIGVVADTDRQPSADHRGQHVGKSDVDPSEVRRGHDHPVGAAHEARYRHTTADQSLQTPARNVESINEVGDIADGLRDSDALPGPRVANRGDHRSVERHDRRADLIDEDLDRQHTDRPIVDSNDRRRPARAPVGFGRLLDDESKRFEFADEAGDRAAGQAGRSDELRSRRRAAPTELIEHERQVRAAQVWRPRGGRHGIAL